MRRRFAFFALTGLFCGCNAILGIESGQFDPPPEAGTEAGTEAGAEAAADASADTGADAPNDARNDAVAIHEGGAPDADAETPDADAAADAETPDADAGAPDASDAGTCGNVLLDPRNCGACGHDCGDGACVNGACQPYVIADIGADEIGSLVVADASGPRVFWTNTTAKKLQTAAATAANSAVEVVLTVAPETFTGRISAAGSHVYFGQTSGNLNRVARVDFTARDTGSETVTDDLSAPADAVLADSDTNILWNEVQPSGNVYQCAAVPCAAPSVVATDSFPQNLAIGGGRIAWSSLTVRDIHVVSGAGTEAFATNASFIAAIAFVRDKLFYSDRSRGIVGLDPSDGGTTSLTNERDVLELAIDPDGTSLWYLKPSVSAGASVLARLSTVNGSGTTVPPAAMASNPHALAVDADRVYWADTSGGHTRVVGLVK